MTYQPHHSEDVSLKTGNEGTVPAAVPADLLELAEALESSASVRGTHHHQADWQRIAQRRAADFLRALATSAPPPVEAREPVAFLLRSPSGTSSLLTEDAPLAADMLQRGWDVQPLVPGGWHDMPAATHPKEPTEARGDGAAEVDCG